MQYRHGEEVYVNRIMIEARYLVKIGIDKQKQREHEEQARAALRCKSASEFLREENEATLS